MAGLKYISWTKEEDNILIEAFTKLKNDFKPTLNNSKLLSEALSGKRTPKACLRRLNRLGLAFYSMKKTKTIIKICSVCGQEYEIKNRYAERKLNKSIRCAVCQEKHEKEYNFRHHEKMIEYYKKWREHNKKVVIDETKNKM